MKSKAVSVVFDRLNEVTKKDIQEDHDILNCNERISLFFKRTNQV